MNLPTHPHRISGGLAAAVILTASAWTAAAAVTVQLQPQSLSVGESARLTVTVQGQGNDAPDVPDIPGLIIDPAGTQSSMSIRNGVMSSNITRIYRVTPEHAGTFTIPAISAGASGSSQPVTLTVSGGGQAPGATGPSAPPPPPVKDDGKMPDGAKELPAFLRVVLPKTDLTVGEIVPVKIKAYFRAGMAASLAGTPPTLSSDAFALSKLSDRIGRSTEKVDGVPFTVLTWTSSLSAVKAGDYPLNIDLPVIVQIPDRSQRGSGRNRMRDMFGDDDLPDMGFDDPIFDQVFGRTTRKEMTLHTDGSEIQISEVPVKDRPADFSGAVGKFDLSATADSATGTTGDPLTLKLAITGNGDFNRVSTGGLDAGPDWKTYRPSGTFAASDLSGLSGTKTFSQSVIPLKAGSQSIPPVTFSYFDPDTKTFVTRRTDPIPVDIKQGAAAPASTTPAATATTAAADKPQAPEPGADGLMPDKPVPTGSGTTLRPLILRPWFITANAVMLGSLILGAAFRHLRARFAAKPKPAGENALQESVNAMEAAMQSRDVPRFFAAARRALQEHLASEWKVPAGQVTLPEIRSRLSGPGSGELRALFETADEVAYAGSRHTPTDLHQWRDLVKTQLRQPAAPAPA